jgi:hypothetical protein
MPGHGAFGNTGAGQPQSPDGFVNKRELILASEGARHHVPRVLHAAPPPEQQIEPQFLEPATLRLP